MSALRRQKEKIGSPGALSQSLSQKMTALLYLLLFDHYEEDMAFELTREMIIKLNSLFLNHCRCPGAQQPGREGAHIDSHDEQCEYRRRAKVLIDDAADTTQNILS